MSRAVKYVFSESISAAREFTNMPPGQVVLVVVDGEVTVQWWCESAAAFNAGEVIDNPGAEMVCPVNRVRFVPTSGTVSVNVIRGDD